jgi:hypothetical protein
VEIARKMADDIKADIQELVGGEIHTIHLGPPQQE